ncbi:MAG: hypothetical protein VB876_13155, partial [Pirellulales bacterium]
EVAHWNRALTNAELQSIYHAGINPNSAPSIAELDGDLIQGYVPGSPNVAIDVAPAATVTDAEQSLSGGHLKVTRTSGGEGVDLLTVRAQQGGTGLDGGTNEVRVAGTTIGVMVSGGIPGQDLVINFNANATAARVTTLMPLLEFGMIGNGGAAHSKALEVEVDDGNGGVTTANTAITLQLPGGVTTTWTGAVSDDWFNAGNWTGNVPGPADKARFSNSDLAGAKEKSPDLGADTANVSTVAFASTADGFDITAKTANSITGPAVMNVEVINTVEGSATLTPNTLIGYAFNVSDNAGDIRLGNIGINGGNGILNQDGTPDPGALISQITIDGNDRIHYENDGEFINGNGGRNAQGFRQSEDASLPGLNQNDNFATAFVGEIVIPDLNNGQPYNVEFGTHRSDDPAQIWVDRNQNGLFEHGQALNFDPGGVSGPYGDMVVNRDCCGNGWQTIQLSPGAYKYAAVMLERGGGSQIEPTVNLNGQGRLTVQPGQMNGLFQSVAKDPGVNPGNDTNNWLKVWDAIDEGDETTGILGGANVVNYASDTEVSFDYGGGGNFGVNRGLSSINSNGPGGGGGPIAGGDNYSVRADGYLQFDNAGTYTIAMGSDDGRQLSLTEAFEGSAPNFAGFSDVHGQVTAQSSSPGGVSDGLEMWFDATDIDAGNNGAAGDPQPGQRVDNWRDKSGKNHHATRATQDPVVLGNKLNGLPVVEAIGEEYWNVPGNTFIKTTFSVFRAGANRTRWDNHGATLNRRSGRGSNWLFENNNTTLHGNQYPQNAWKNGQQINSPFNIGSINEFMVFTVQVNANDTAPREHWLGRSDHSQTDIEMAEVIAYDRVLSAGERQAVESYLGAKWGVGGGGGNPATETAAWTKVWDAIDEG